MQIATVCQTSAGCVCVDFVQDHIHCTPAHLGKESEALNGLTWCAVVSGTTYVSLRDMEDAAQDAKVDDALAMHGMALETLAAHFLKQCKFKVLFGFIWSAADSLRFF